MNIDHMRWIVAAAAIALLAASGCTRRVPAAPAPPSTVGVGECADPERDGVVSDAPDLIRADRDLDGGGTDEILAADRALCGDEGNCHWNVFASAESGCLRYVGTIAAAAIERLDSRGEDGFHDLRGWWQLAGEGRMLMQEYGFSHGGYRVIEALPCATDRGGRIVCGEDAQAERSDW